MEHQNAESLIEKGRESLLKGEFQKAAKAFAKALEHRESPVLRNNLAFANFMAGKHQQAFQDLRPLLDEGREKEANPFTFALASRICCALGEAEKARQWLDKAIRRFDEGLREIRRQHKEYDPDSEAFLEYTAIIMQAAGDLRDHRLVYDLFRRWELYHTSWINAFMAAIACFNMGRYKQAASLWSNLSHFFSACSVLAKIAFAIERGMIPPFEMSYSFPPDEEVKKMLKEAAKDEEMRRRCIENSYFKVLMLERVLDDKESHDARQTLYNLIYYGGEWGERLGESVFKSPIFPVEMKLVAAQALIERGILKPGEPIKMVIDGKEETVHIDVKTPEIVGERDEKLDSLVQEAKKLRDEGKTEEAIAILDELYTEGVYYPPAMLTLANLLRSQNRLREARNILELLESMAPDSPPVLFNLASLMVQLEEPEKARSYMERIDLSSATEEIKAKLPILKNEIAKLEIRKQLEYNKFSYVSPEELMRYFTESKRKEIEDKPLPVDATLARGLKNMPAKWLTAACKAYGLEPAPHRPERERQLIEFLSDRRNIEKAIVGLTPKQRRLISFLLEQGGWSTISPVTQKFGPMSDDGFFWDEKGPKSALGNLWMRCLVMVGKTKLSGRNYKIATIPLELREPLKEILES
ncbi:MAG: tetratricopeptide repeat protein [Thermacetogeniaceae bacterium]